MRVDTFRLLFVTALTLVVAGCATPLRGTGDLGIIIERANGSVQVIETTGRTRLARVTGLGDLSHASVVYARDQRHAYVFGRDGGMSLTASAASATPSAATTPASLAHVPGCMSLSPPE